jgi:hypothetical protein
MKVENNMLLATSTLPMPSKLTTTIHDWSKSSASFRRYFMAQKSRSSGSSAQFDSDQAKSLSDQTENCGCCCPKCGKFVMI